MKKKLAIVFVTALLLGLGGFVSASGQLSVCHFPPGNPSNYSDLLVGAEAVDAHLAHGDWTGTCNNPS